MSAIGLKRAEWVAMQRDLRHDQAVLYRFWDRDLHLLYIGVSRTPAYRWESHQRKPWWREVATITYEVHPSSDGGRSDGHLLAIEMAAIKSEHPKYNSRGAVPQ